MTTRTSIDRSIAAHADSVVATPADHRRWRLTSTVLRAITSYLAYRALRVAEAQLRSLDARILKDIGLDRSEVGAILADLARERRHRVHKPLPRSC